MTVYTCNDALLWILYLRQNALFYAAWNDKTFLMFLFYVILINHWHMYPIKDKVISF